MKFPLIALITIAGGLISQADLLVYEPFDYGTANDETFGRVAGRNGGLAVADPKKYPEFAGNVFTVDTRPFQREVAASPKDDGSHWHNNGETLYLIGKGMGNGMVKMLAP